MLLTPLVGHLFYDYRQYITNMGQICHVLSNHIKTRVLHYTKYIALIGYLELVLCRTLEYVTPTL